MLIDARQNFYFEQLFKTLEVIGFNKPTTHVPYEFVTLKDGAMASRTGNVVLFESFYQQVVERAKIETQKRHTNWSDKQLNQTACKIALSAIKFNMLKVGNQSVIVFDIDEALSFDGFSGPYIQYTCSRINSILKKSKLKLTGAIDYQKLNTDYEKQLIIKLAQFPETVSDSVKEYQLSDVTKYLFDLSKIFSGFYQKIPILNSDLKTQKARLALIVAVKQTLENGLTIMGIETVTKM